MQFVVSMCIGVGNIGWTLIVLGFFSAITSIIYAQMVKWFHRVPFAISAAFMNLFFFIFMAFFPRRPSYELAFLFAIFWGIGGGIWNTLSSSESVCVVLCMGVHMFLCLCVWCKCVCKFLLCIMRLYDCTM